MSSQPRKSSGKSPAKVLPVLLTVVIGAIVAIYTARQDPPPDVAASMPTPQVEAEAAGPRAAFDFYLLVMTLHASFCEDNTRKSECRIAQPRPLVIHGLWPERLAPRAYPRDCPAPRLSLEPALERELAPLMPGMADGLHVHEWREHGGCSGLDDDAYFRHTLELARVLDAALAPKLTTLAGREADTRTLRAAANAHRPGLGATLTFHCRTPRGGSPGGRPRLIEVRQCVDDDGPGGAPGTPLDCATVDRRDQGCGQRFLVAGP